MGTVKHKQVAALAMAVLMLAAVVHASMEFDCCLFYGTSHRGANHSSHVCQGCSLSSWTAGPNSPVMDPFSVAAPMEWNGAHPVRTVACHEVSAPRAPPAFLA